MIEEYIQYWGLTQHPFLMAPDSKMMCMTGQYFECFERLKYAISTNKGGVLIVSEDAGLGKTTTLLRLVDDMKEEYGSAFRYAFVDHPALSSAQMIAQITGGISGQTPSDDKLKNLMLLRETLTEAKEQGGKSIIIVDEGQMLCEAHDILQELRALINMTHNGEYLHTFILSGQRALWNTIKGMPEFWQRLPVRYYFIPLRLEETKELVRFRLHKAGLDEARVVFADDALEIIHRYSRGSPRTVIALSDLSLLVGFTGRSDKVSFKEVSKAINTMSGKGETLPYMTGDQRRDRGPSLSSVAQIDRGSEIGINIVDYDGDRIGRYGTWPRITSSMGLLLFVVACLSLVLAGILGYHYGFRGSAEKNKAEVTGTQRGPQTQETDGGHGTSDESTAKGVVIEKFDVPVKLSDALKEAGLAGQGSAKTKAGAEDGPSLGPEAVPQGTGREAVVIAAAANIRVAPGVESPRFAMLFEGETVRVLDEREDDTGMKWYKITLYGNRQGWIADSVVTFKP
jgi:type II secretory pathway predicted ATPase ExeA